MLGPQGLIRDAFVPKSPGHALLMYGLPLAMGGMTLANTPPGQRGRAVGALAGNVIGGSMGAPLGLVGQMAGGALGGSAGGRTQRRRSDRVTGASRRPLALASE